MFPSVRGCERLYSIKYFLKYFSNIPPVCVQCTWCGEAHLCGEEHLRLHRPNTKCFPFRVGKIEGAGRGLVASRNIRARETVLTEVAGVKGPGLVTSPVCPSCLAPVKPPLLPCSRCSLPVCSPACQESPAHSQVEWSTLIGPDTFRYWPLIGGTHESPVWRQGLCHNNTTHGK